MTTELNTLILISFALCSLAGVMNMAILQRIDCLINKIDGIDA